VPDNPHITVKPVGGGVDPQFQIGVKEPAIAGGQVTVPVKLDIEAAATNVGGFDFDLFFDPSQLTIDVPDGVSPGADTTGNWVVASTLVAAGHLRIGILNSGGQPLSAGLREIAQLQFHVEASAGSAAFRRLEDDRLKLALQTLDCVAALDIEPVDPHAGGYTWTAVDGSVAIAAPWHNAADPFDVNGDGLTTPGDVLILVNYLNAHPGQVALPSLGSTPHRYDDVNDDQLCTALDVLTAINHFKVQPELVAEVVELPAEKLRDRVLGEWGMEFPSLEGLLTDVANDRVPAASARKR